MPFYGHAVYACECFRCGVTFDFRAKEGLGGAQWHCPICQRPCHVRAEWLSDEGGYHISRDVVLALAERVTSAKEVLLDVVKYSQGTLDKGASLMQRVAKVHDALAAPVPQRWWATDVRVVCLCGSTRFYEAFQQANYEETMKGCVVLSVGFFGGSVHAQAVGCTPAQKVQLDELHKRKIDLADEVLVLDVDGYIGESTKSEIAYAEGLGKLIRYLSKERPR